MEDRQNPTQSNTGMIAAIRGSVVDVRFPQQLPNFLNQLIAGERRQFVMEVVAHLSADLVRCIALTPTVGLARGTPVEDLGHPLQVPVGQEILGRIFNVFGDTVDQQKPLSNLVVSHS